MSGEETEENKLEKNLKKIEKTKEELKQVILKIEDYNSLMAESKNQMGEKVYKSNIDKRDNLAISLNYLQNDVIIEKDNQIIEYLKGIYIKEVLE